MSRAIRARLLTLIPVLLGMTLFVFLVMRSAPDGPASVMLGPSADVWQQPQREPGLDRPWPIQYVIWLGQMLGGDLGRSVSLSRPVADVVLSALGPTLLLIGVALAAGSLIGLTVGVSAARYQRLVSDRDLRLLVLLGISTQPILLGLLSMLVLAVWLCWFPVSGMLYAFGDGGVLDLLSHLVLPTLSLALVPGAVIARVAWAAAADVLQQEPIAMARARGVGEGRVFKGHVYRTVLPRLAPVIGLQIGFLIGGAVYIETIFHWPGLGRLLVDAVLIRDIPLVQGVLLVLAAFYVMAILVVDLVQLRLDSRTRDG